MVLFNKLAFVIVLMGFETKFAHDAIPEIDQNGYIIFCLCMGRLGNQMEHFLGGLAFAKSLNRTLILPPFRSFKNVEYDEWFNVAAISKYHRVILAKDFMKHLSPTVWPKDKRYGFCYVFHGEKCEMKIGNPFTNFWDELNVDFAEIVPYSISYQQSTSIWQSEYPPSIYPVLALRGAPAPFPMVAANAPLQKYIEFSKEIMDEVDSLIRRHFNGSRNYVGVHLRNGEDWVKTCKMAPDVPKLMASYQCTGFDYKKPLTSEMCYPSKEELVRKTKNVVEREGAEYLFVATDKSSMIKEFSQAMPNIKIIHVDPWLPLIDVAILSESKHFIGNCVSSFSSFVWRQRLYHDKGPTSYFGTDT